MTKCGGHIEMRHIDNMSPGQFIGDTQNFTPLLAADASTQSRIETSEGQAQLRNIMKHQHWKCRHILNLNARNSFDLAKTSGRHRSPAFKVLTSVGGTSLTTKEPSKKVANRQRLPVDVKRP